MYDLCKDLVDMTEDQKHLILLYCENWRTVFNLNRNDTMKIKNFHSRVNPKSKYNRSINHYGREAGTVKVHQILVDLIEHYLLSLVDGTTK